MNQLLFEWLKRKQFVLDETIKERFGLEGRVLVQDKLISLDVELSEFANEVRFFKFWSEKPMNRDKALVEFVDCLHFFCSIANDLNLVAYYDPEFKGTGGNLKTDYLRCKKHVIGIFTSESMEYSFLIAFNWFWSMGERVGFSEEEIIQAYKRKQDINFKRQEAGY